MTDGLYQQALDALIAEKGPDVTITDLLMLREAWRPVDD